MCYYVKHKSYLDTKFLNISIILASCGVFVWSQKLIRISTLSIKTIRKEEPRLIGIYDMLGRPVYNIRENEILIYVYSDGRRVKQAVK